MLPSDEGAVRHPQSDYCEPPPNKIIFSYQQSSTSRYFEHLDTSPSQLSHSPLGPSSEKDADENRKDADPKKPK